MTRKKKQEEIDKVEEFIAKLYRMMRKYQAELSDFELIGVLEATKLMVHEELYKMSQED